MSEAAQVQEVQSEEAKVKAKASKSTGNLIFDIAQEVENLTKTKALNAAEKLAEDIETNYFRLGGILKQIKAQQWWEGHPSFEAFLQDKFDFGERKADYLIEIYTHLVDKQIPWEKVAHLGWTKLTLLAKIITPETLDAWIEKATPLTVAELKALVKGEAAVGGQQSASTTSSVVRMAFKLHTDQHETVQTALAKAKGELSTDHDNVALAGICSGYLANTYAVNAGAEVDMLAKFKELGPAGVLGIFEQAWPDIELEVTMPQPAEATA